ncbi:ionotropic receptor 75a-like [Trichoplusia ni]|uniref:Ionotropic receptor 75a-like n=1 Tax=Trichoplusia ni TaxID=7111 RepID=A0A7E5WJ84_TRINI|nr:ionotropic receptor 75a-like [Trichoplusia ni]
MWVQAVAEFFKYKVVSSIIVLACWPPKEQIRIIGEISHHGLSATFSCDPGILDYERHGYLQGVLYLVGNDDSFMFKKVTNPLSDITKPITSIAIDDVYVHPRDGVSAHRWAYWASSTGFVLTHDRERILRRLDLKEYPWRIATPIGHYSSEKYDGTFVDFLVDESISDQDPGIRSGYSTSMLLIEAVNARDILIENELWATMVNNDSMYLMVSEGTADLSGAILRILLARTFDLDYVVPIWPFSVGFTYLAERESASNMFLEPFSPGVWWSCLAIMAVLALVERFTAKTPLEKDGAFYTVLTTWLQQDASAVPESASGRFAFTVLSVSAMLVHAYYTSAIVSALMSTGRGGPDSLRALADSKYAIGSEDYDYMRYLFFDVETNWEDLEYLKKKKKTSKFYQDLSRGVELIQQGNTAFHTEYNQIYPHFKTFSDDHICKLQHVDTIPETLSWVTTTKNGQWTQVLRSAGGWLVETGLSKRLVSRLRIPHPPCRASLLAERVKLGDIAPLLALTVFGAFLSVVMLGAEIMYHKAKAGRMEVEVKPSLIDDVDVERYME